MGLFSAIGAGLNLAGGLWGGRQQQKAYNQAAGASRWAPVDVTGPFGTGAFKEVDGRMTAQSTLSPEMMGLAEQLRGLGSGFLSQAGTFDPYEAASQQFGRIEDILSPHRERERAGMESRLFAQGRLGSTGGALTEEAFQSAVEQQRKQNLLAALQEAQNIQEGLFSRGLRGVQRYQDIQQMPLELLRLGGDFGQQQTAGNKAEAALRLQGRQARTGSILSAIGGLGSGIGGMSGNSLAGLSGIFGGGAGAPSAPTPWYGNPF